ncbi:MAG TPA: sigma-54 dependent transcriptional regulator [Rhodocyclaceae bacterium]|nr:sigma-54 dependent transcriptional regulator [Rhodocyclaceae bacterium]
MVFVKGEKRTRGDLPRVLVVDDEADIRELIDLTLSRMGLAADCVGSVGEARAAIDREVYALCLTDMRLPDGEGLDVVRYIGANSPATPVAVITAYGSTDNAISAMKAGAFDYLAKPVGLDALRTLVRSALPVGQTEVEGSTATLIGASAPMDQVREMIGKLARSQAPVCVTGESGTGKELAARLIHRNGPRGAAPFVPVNCGAIPDNLMESEFFGYRKGAFTGALEDRDGFFQAANGGTLFLDEVADLPLPMQVKLLRAIQERRVRKVGSASEEAVDVRIISATHRDLKAEMESGKFRQDLFYRLNVIELRMPSLRERSEDIPLLVKEILARESEAISITAEANLALAAYDFPGNVRELENILERAIALCSDRVIRIEDLQISPPPDQDAPEDAAGGLQAMLDRIERQAIVDALAQTNGNRTAAARLLGVTFRSLRYRIERLGVEVE